MSTKERIISKAAFAPYRERRRAYLDWKSGEGCTHDGRAFRVPPAAPLARILRDTPASIEQLFFCDRPGEAGAGVLAWLEDPELWREWETGKGGIHRDPERFVIRLVHRQSNRRVELYSLSPWFGEGAHPRAARAAFKVLGELLKEKFYGAMILPTPARTGLDLWDRRRSRSEYPVLPDDLLDLIRSTSGQGRVELFHPGPGPAGDLPGFYYYDARWAYAAFTRRMPVVAEPRLEPLVDEVPEHDPYRPGRYLISFKVPPRWDHLGIFAVPTPERDPFTGEKFWTYPAEPGAVWETWADHAELLLAERYGWEYEIRRRILFELPDQRGTAPEPLRAWRDNLVVLREKADALGEEGTIPAPLASMVSGAIRNIFVQAIGSFHRSRRTAWHVVPRSDLRRVPAELEHTIELMGRLATYREDVPLSWDQKRHAHPEWSSTIWAKTRARMLYSEHFQGGAETGALTLSRADVLAIRTDALYLSRDPGWPESGGVGELRLKGAIREPVAAPRSPVELNRLRDRAEREAGRERGD